MEQTGILPYSSRFTMLKRAMVEIKTCIKEICYMLESRSCGLAPAWLLWRVSCKAGVA